MKHTINEPKFKIYDNGELHVCISSKNIKLGNIPQFNTLPGDEPLTFANGQQIVNIKGTCGSCCKDCKSACYAIRSTVYHNNSVVPAWGRNTVILRNDPQKVRTEIKEFCTKNIVKYFRFHTSGELENEEQLKLYCDICKDNPDVVFYIYTKRFDLIANYFIDSSVPENFVINLSEWHGNIEKFINTEVQPSCQDKVRDLFNSLNIFFYDDNTDERFVGAAHCPAIDRDGHETGVTCAQCRRCMKKGSKTAVYAH